MVRLWKNQKGSSVVGQLVATGIALGAFFIIFEIINHSTKTYQRVELTQRMIEAEIRLLAFYANYENLKGMASKLKEAHVPSGDLKADGLTIGRINAPLYVTDEGIECGNASDPLCQIRVETAIACNPLPSGAGADCKAAYRISSIKRTSVPLGTTHAGPFVATDYKVPISYELSMREETSTCDFNLDMFSAGLNKETGKIYCVKKPTKKCASHQIAKGFKYNAATGAAELICEDTQTVTCPPNYVVSSLTPSSLEQGATKNATCVYVTQRTVPWKENPPLAQAVSGKFCPRNYRAIATCALEGASSTPGACSYECATGACERPAVIVSGTVTLVHQVDQTASCTLNRPAQECGASWTANVRLTGYCELIPPETVRPL